MSTYGIKVIYGQAYKPWQKLYKIPLHMEYINECGEKVYKLNVSMRFFRIASCLKGRNNFCKIVYGKNEIEKIVKQIKEEVFAIEEHAILVHRSHILDCDVNLGDDINIIIDKAKLIQDLVKELEKEIE